MVGCATAGEIWNSDYARNTADVIYDFNPSHLRIFAHGEMT